MPEELTIRQALKKTAGLRRAFLWFCLFLAIVGCLVRWALWLWPTTNTY